MARLQDFPSVTPTSSDKLLVVQSQGQGLVPYGSKLDSVNPSGSGTFTFNGNEVLAGDLTINGDKSIKTELLDKTTSTVTTDTDNVDRITTNSLIKKNGMVQLDLLFYPKALSTLQNKKLATIPTGYRPSSNIATTATLVPVYNQLSKTMAMEVQITPSGEIRCPNNGAYAEIGGVTPNTQITVHCCYFV